MIFRNYRNRILGLFIDPQHPKGANAIYPAVPTTPDVQATSQRDYTVRCDCIKRSRCFWLTHRAMHAGGAHANRIVRAGQASAAG